MLFAFVDDGVHQREGVIQVDGGAIDEDLSFRHDEDYEEWSCVGFAD